jgi:hypothetical protein
MGFLKGNSRGFWGAGIPVQFLLHVRYKREINQVILVAEILEFRCDSGNLIDSGFRPKFPLLN